jgi:hypothetical protein
MLLFGLTGQENSSLLWWWVSEECRESARYKKRMIERRATVSDCVVNSDEFDYLKPSREGWWQFRKAKKDRCVAERLLCGKRRTVAYNIGKIVLYKRGQMNEWMLYIMRDRDEGSCLLMRLNKQDKVGENISGSEMWREGKMTTYYKSSMQVLNLIRLFKPQILDVHFDPCVSPIKCKPVHTAHQSVSE